MALTQKNIIMASCGLVACRAVQFGLLALLITLMAVVYFVLFFMGGEYGRGDEVFLLLQSYGSFFYACALASAGMTLFLAVFDVGYWRGPFKFLGYLLMAATLTLYVLTALSFTAEFPASPIVVYMAICPALIYVFRLTPIYHSQPVSVFVFHLAILFGLVSVVSLGIWLFWLIFYNMWWHTPVKADFYVRLGCLPAIPAVNLTEVVNQVEAQSGCNAAIVEWISPLILAVFCILLSVSMFVLVRAESAKQKDKRQMDFKTQAFVVLLSLVLLGMWASAGIAGANIHLSSIVFCFCFLFLVVGSSLMLLTSGRQGVINNMKSIPLAKRVLDSINSDWLRSLMLLGAIPFSLVVLPLSRMRQLGRRYLFFTKKLEPKERALFFDLEATRMLAQARQWHWTSVFAKMIWWGIAFFSLSVICARVLNVVFSGLGAQIDAMGLTLGPVVGLFIVVGFLLFQFPPTPGMPVFYACSVIVTKSAMTEGWDFWAGWALSTLISLLLKYSSLISGQLIGQVWGKYSVGIRKTVGINSLEMRAIRYILTKPGLNFRKSAMLCGAPDWPAAVICGILRTSYLQNIIHQFPVVIIILPITLSGSMTLMASSNVVYQSAATICLSIAVLCQGLSMLIAMHYIEDTVQYKQPELDKFEADAKVAELDAKDRARAKHRSQVSRWPTLPLVLKAILVSGVVAEAGSMYLFLLFSARCFVAFDVTDSIADKLDGNAINLVKPLGWAGIGAFAYGCIVLIVLGRWISCQKSSPRTEAEEGGEGGGGGELAVTATSSKEDDQRVDDDVAAATTEEQEDHEDEVFSKRYTRCCGTCQRD